MLALVASIPVLDTACIGGRRGWSGQARPWREKAASADFARALPRNCAKAGQSLGV